MSDKVVIDGDMTLTSTIDGEGNAVIRLGQNPVIEPLDVTENGTYEVPEGVDGYSPVIVNTEVDALRSEINSAIEASGCNPLVEGLNALTTHANETTGASDTTLSDAVETLVAGYGGGSTPTTIAVINSDTKFISFSNSDRWYSGETNKFFNNFRNLEVLYMDSVKKIGGSFFSDLRSLKAGIFPEVTTVGNNSFYNVGVASEIALDFHQTITASGLPFKIDNLILILRGSTKSSVSIKKGTWGHPSQAKFYVPQSLVSEYVADSDIIAYGEENILPIEGSQYESIDWWKALI